jgi:2C-methyl-D-erythritol 2,4-cyclodiphosphate synthase
VAGGAVKVYALIIDDRHSDTDVQVFSIAEAAVDAANAIATKYAYRPEDIQGENIDGFLLWIRYGVEGDHVAVVERELDAEVSQ